MGWCVGRNPPFVELDGNITEDKDVLYAIIPSKSVLGKAYHIRPGANTGLYSTTSQLGIGFGPSINSETPIAFGK